MTEQGKLKGFSGLSMLVLAGVFTGLSASLVDIAAYFEIPATRAGILYTYHFVGFFGFIVLSLPVWSVRLRLRLVTWTATFYAIALALVALAPSYTVFAIVLIVVGGCGGVLESHTATLQVRLADSQAEAGAAVNTTQVFFALGALCAPLYMAARTDSGDWWRLLFATMAGFAALAAAVGATFRGERFPSVRRTTTTASPTKPGTLPAISIAMASYVGAEVIVFGWTPAVMELFHGIPAPRARFAPSVFWIGMFIGRVVVARLTRRVSLRALLNGATTIAIAGVALLVLANGEIGLWLATGVCAVAFAGIWPLIVTVTGRRNHETATGIVVAAGGAGGAIFPYLAGRSAEVLSGHLIPATAIPLFAVVLFVTVRLGVGDSDMGASDGENECRTTVQRP